MVDSSKPVSSQDSSTRIKFASIFETVDVSKRRTKIICTLGQSCSDVDQVVKMIDAGMNVARLDFSQGDHKSNGQLVQNLQAGLKQRPDKVVAMVLETKGPEIRTGVLKDGKDVTVEAGQALEVFTDYAIEGDDTKITCNYKSLPATVSIGSSICVGEGVLNMEVIEVCEVSQTPVPL
jgi:pyruvate kinase